MIKKDFRFQEKIKGLGIRQGIRVFPISDTLISLTIYYYSSLHSYGYFIREHPFFGYSNMFGLLSAQAGV
jgi:hypothetical protein